jgi:hypothetical protein
MAQPAGFVNRAGAIQGDATTLYWMTSFFDHATGTFAAFQLFTSSDQGSTWATAADNDTANWFYNFDTGGSLQAPHAQPIFGNPGLSFTLIASGGISKVYAFTQCRNSSTGIFQSYLLNNQSFGAGSPLSISGTPPNGTVGVSYGFCFSASGGTPPYTFAIVSGSVPTGTSLDPSTGCITGTPTAAGVFCFTIQVTDSLLATATTSPCITIVAGSLIVQLIGWKLYPLEPCGETAPAPVIPAVKRAM